MLENLKEKLILNGVKLTLKSTKELWKQVSADGDSILDGVIELFETVINLIKSNGYSIATVRQLNIGNSNAQNNNTIWHFLNQYLIHIVLICTNTRKLISMI